VWYVGDSGVDEPFGVLFLLPQGGQCLAESFDFAEPRVLLGLGDALSEVVFQVAHAETGRKATVTAVERAWTSRTPPSTATTGT
jgi:hypothetical protein